MSIPEYFAYAPRRQRLVGWRLPSAGARSYDPIAPHEGRWRSALLGLELALEDGRLRFYHGSAALLDATELIARLGAMADAATRRAEQEAQRAEQEAQRGALRRTTPASRHRPRRERLEHPSRG
ncbi:MAG TPA: hypothetical protein VML75_29015 [Kofleriaceae bacterium]|nr:hypothetical protein [Kofleriaceae bacterium]